MAAQNLVSANNRKIYSASQVGFTAHAEFCDPAAEVLSASKLASLGRSTWAALISRAAVCRQTVWHKVYIVLKVHSACIIQVYTSEKDKQIKLNIFCVIFTEDFH